jgi:hypothetical protein
VVETHGEIDLSCADRLDEMLRAIPPDAPALLDLSRCDFLDITALNTIIRHSLRRGQQGGRLLVTAPPATNPRHLIDLLRATSLLELYESSSAALRAADPAGIRASPNFDVDARPSTRAVTSPQLPATIREDRQGAARDGRLASIPLPESHRAVYDSRRVPAICGLFHAGSVEVRGSSPLISILEIPASEDA